MRSCVEFCKASLRRSCVDMLSRWILYLISLIGCIGFYVAYGQWLSWLLLMALMFFPLLSLLLSLPAMLLLKARFSFPSAVSVGAQITLNPQLKCPLPLPLVSWKYHISTSYTGEMRKQKDDAPLAAKHCGCISLELRKARKYDYLGLFWWWLFPHFTQEILVLPRPIPVENIPSLKRYLAARWKPKAGGGFAENYELRVYRPGDNLRQMHWKLAAKTGKLITREPMIPVRGKMALTMCLSGSADEIDEKLGKLLYVSQYLLKQGLPHELHCLTGDGLKVHAVSDKQTLDTAIAELLRADVAITQEVPTVRASWLYHIGGERDET